MGPAAARCWKVNPSEAEAAEEETPREPKIGPDCTRRATVLAEAAPDRRQTMDMNPTNHSDDPNGVPAPVVVDIRAMSPEQFAQLAHLQFVRLGRRLRPFLAGGARGGPFGIGGGFGNSHRSRLAISVERMN